MHVRVGELYMSPCEGILDISHHVQVGEPTICRIAQIGVLYSISVSVWGSTQYLSPCMGGNTFYCFCLDVWVARVVDLDLVRS